MFAKHPSPGSGYRSMNVVVWVLIALFAVVAITYFTGPRIPVPAYVAELPEVPTDPAGAAAYLDEKEAAAPTRPDNAAHIVWHEGAVRKTPLSIVYLHGFGGSYRDGYPVSQQVADSLGANLLQARWGNHGLTPDHALVGMTPESCWADAREALALGLALGERVVILSTSTGGTLAIKLAAEFPDRVAAIVNISPNVEDDMPGAWLLNSPWGYELAHLVSLGEHRKVSHEEPAARQYFDTIFPAKALVDLEVLVSTTMTEATFRRVRCPVQTLYYYRNWLNEDERVEVDVYPAMHEQFATPREQQELIRLPTPETHWMGSDIKSKDVDATRVAILAWLRRMV